MDSSIHHIKVHDDTAPNGTRTFQSVCVCGWVGWHQNVPPGLNDIDRISAIDEARLRAGAQGGAHLKYPDLNNSELGQLYKVNPNA